MVARVGPHPSPNQEEVAMAKAYADQSPRWGVQRGPKAKPDMRDSGSCWIPMVPNRGDHVERAGGLER